MVRHYKIADRTLWSGIYRIMNKVKSICEEILSYE